MLPRDLSPASFRGVRFLVPGDSAEEGRNSIRHATPDSSFHYLEDNGLHPPEFKIYAILAGPNLPAQWKSLRAALTRPGPGLLKHPWYGNQFVMVDGKFQVTRDDRDANTLEIDIPFSVTGPPALPGALAGVPAFVTSLATSALTAMFQSFASRYGNPLSNTSAGVIVAAVQAAGGVLDARFAASGPAPASLVLAAPSLARDPVALATSLHAAVRTPLDDTAYDGRAIVNGFLALADAAASSRAVAEAISPTTADLAARADTMTLLADTIEAAAFFGMADGMAGRVYTTADEVRADESRLAAALDSLQERDLAPDVHRAALDVHAAAADVLADVAVRLPKLTEVTPRQPIPASVLGYMLYGGDAQTQTLVDLNIAQNPVLMAGAMTVLME